MPDNPAYELEPRLSQLVRDPAHDAHMASIQRAYADGRRDERASVAAYLFKRQANVLPGTDGSALMADTFRHAAVCIQSGAHAPKPNPSKENTNA